MNEAKSAPVASPPSSDVISVSGVKNLPNCLHPMVYIDPGRRVPGRVVLCVRWGVARLDVDLPAADAAAVGAALYGRAEFVERLQKGAAA